MQHTAVAMVAVIGVPDSVRGEVVKAFIVPREGTAVDAALEASVQNFVKARLSPYKFPRWIEFIDELPKTATGKIQRYKLRELATTRKG